MDAASSEGAQVKVTVHEAVIARGEHGLLDKAAFTKLVDLLRLYPSLGTPRLFPQQGVIRCFEFDGREIFTQRLSEDELQIKGIRRPT
jgi:hypothetical protein